VISDIAMPGMDGYELLTRLRALEEGRRIPAIALTPFARAEDRTRSLLAGYQGHVPKPVDPSELLATVASLLQLSERSNDTPKGVSP
jgi:CheY-like chemotaxis protein